MDEKIGFVGWFEGQKPIFKTNVCSFLDAFTLEVVGLRCRFTPAPLPPCLLTMLANLG